MMNEIHNIIILVSRCNLIQRQLWCRDFRHLLWKDKKKYLFTRFIKSVNNPDKSKTTILMMAHIQNNHRCNNLLFRCFVDGKGLYRERVHRGSRWVNRVEIVLDERAEGRRDGTRRGWEVGELEETAGRATVRWVRMRNLRPTVRIANPFRVPLYYFK